MNRMRHFLPGLCIAIVLTCGNPAFARSHKAPAPVPATQEIEVLDPGAHPAGNPTVVPTIGPSGQNQIDIPPVVLVHRYYYTGDRTFQGPLFSGGPSIIVVTHPKCGERLYLPVQMLPGAPKVTYTHETIAYDYGPQSIHLRFSKVGDPKIVYRQGTSAGEKVKEFAVKISDGAKSLVRRTDLPAAIDRSKELTRNVVTNSVDRTNDFIRDSAVPIQNLIRSIPGVEALTADPEDRARRARDAELRRASARLEQMNLTIPTNR